MSKELLEKLQGEIADLTKSVQERTKTDAEIKELSEKLEGLMAEKQERKVQFEATKMFSTDTEMKKQVEKKMDELHLAQALCTNAKTGQFNRDLYRSITKQSDYAQAIDIVKASGFDFGGATTTDGDGGDFIPPGFSNTMLSDIFLELKVAGLFKRFNMTSPAFTWPISVTDLTARKGTEATAVTKDEIVTSELIFTAKKLMNTIDFTNELEQDAIAALLPFIREKVVKAFAKGQEQICINGDTTAGASHIAGNVDADDARRVQNGVRKMLNAAEKISLASGGITEANLRSLRVAMGKYGVEPGDLAYVVNVADYLKMLNATNFPNYQSISTYGNAAQILTGQMGWMDGIPIIVSELLPSNLNASGVYDGVTTTKSICLLVNKNAYMWGDRKEFSMETFYNPIIQATSLIGSERLDFQKMLPASAATAAAGINY